MDARQLVVVLAREGVEVVVTHLPFSPKMSTSAVVSRWAKPGYLLYSDPSAPTEHPCEKSSTTKEAGQIKRAYSNPLFSIADRQRRLTSSR